jgi:hypothetical protein
MSGFYLALNFAGAALFFLAFLALCGLMLWKLQGWWRITPPLAAVAAGVGLGFAMWGQFWVDAYRNTSLQVEARRGVAALARSAAKQRAEVDGRTGGGDLLIDQVSIDEGTAQPGGSRVADATVSFLFEKEGRTGRIYVRCTKIFRRQWVVERIYTRDVAGGKVVETDLWKS